MGDRRLDGTVVHRGATAPATGATRLRLNLVEALAQVIDRESEEQALACMDSARHLRLLTGSQLDALARRTHGRGRSLIAESSKLAESGIETLVRVRLRRA
ncbi:MAG: hypothetical protein JWO10_1019, partial [Microbacteriaceae bacterium]|nr:hypothetical protein [Microbacteriaceae bacterium]